MLRSGNAMLGERKHVTILFADLRGSTALIDQVDPEHALAIIAPVIKVLMEAVHQNDGFVNQTRGDGIMAMFGAPLACEEHAVRACHAALAMREGVRALRRERANPIDVRIGLNSGEVVIHSIGNDLSMHYEAAGKTTHLAARMEALAEPGVVLMTAATYHLAKGFVDVKPRGSQPVRGIHEPVEVFELLDAPARTRWQVRAERGLSALMGRTAERAVLREAYEGAADRKGKAIAVIGTPGVGKSRLVHEFIRLNVARNWIVLETACASQRTSSSYDAISTLVRTWFKLGPGDAPNEVAARVREQIAQIDPALLSFTPAVLSLLDLNSDEPAWQGLDPVQRRQQVGEAVRALILAQARKAPLLILVEDLHWADTETALVLDGLADALHSVPLLIVATRRPEASASAAFGPAWIRLTLPPLDATEAGQLLDWLMGGDIGLTQLKRRLLTQAQGNPLFLEELVRSLQEANVLEGEQGHYRAGKPAERIEIPQTVQSVLAARIDLLDGMPKTVLQTAAIIGKDVPVDLLSRMVDIPAAQLAAQLEVLEAADFLYTVKSASAPEYSFKHELTREVAYNTVLMARRRTLHSLAVQIIEANFADRLDEQVDRLADHAYSGELWEKAVPYQLRSARRAMKRWANHEVIRIVERGIETLSHLPDSPDKWKAAIDFRLAAVIALEPLGRHRRIAEVLAEASQFTEAAGDARRTAGVNCQLAVALWRLGKHGAAMAAAEAAYDSANETRSTPFVFAALHNIGIIHHETGAFRKAVEVHRRCQALITPELDEKRAGWASFPSVTLHTFLADSLLELGEIEEAEAMAEEAVRRADAVNHAYSRSFIYHIRSRIHLAKGEVAAAVSLMEEAWRICVDLEIIQMYPVTAGRLGEAYLDAGKVDAALKIVSLPEKLDVPQAENTYGWYYLFLAQGRAHLMSGRHADALAAAEKALKLANERGERPQQAHALRLLGEICAAPKHRSLGDAEKYLRDARDLAEDCSMRLLAERCRASLGKVEQPWTRRVLNALRGPGGG